MRGEFDPILSDEYREYYIDNIPKGNIITVNECGHFIHTDKVDEYVDIIRDFIDIQESPEKISITVETLQIWCERMRERGVIDKVAYEYELEQRKKRS